VQQACKTLAQYLLASEDFEGGLTPDASVGTCNEPVNSSSNDACFVPGDLVDGFSITSSTGGGIVVLGANFLGGNQASAVIGANTFTDSTIVTFDAPVTAISADYYGGFNVDLVTVEAFDETSTSLGTATVQPSATDTSAFLGIISDTPIASITITAANDDGELLDNLRFGDVQVGPSDVIFADGFDTTVTITAPTVAKAFTPPSTTTGSNSTLTITLDNANAGPATLSADPQPTARLGAPHMAPIELLHPNPDQPRKVFSDAELDELAASIREKGVIQPLLVRPTAAGGEYEIVAGERRWRAAQRAGVRELPVVIRTLADGEVLEIGIIENVQRVDLNPIEEALAYRQLIERFGRTQDAVAEVVGKSRPHVANALRLLNLPEAVQGYVLQGQLTAGHARAVLSSADPVTLARQVIDQNLSVRQAESRARAVKNGRTPRELVLTADRKVDADIAALERQLGDMLGLKVQVANKGQGGTVSLHYSSLDQLDMICQRLSGEPI